MCPSQPCAEISSVFIIRPTAQRYGGLVNISVTSLAGEAGRMQRRAYAAKRVTTSLTLARHDAGSRFDLDHMADHQEGRGQPEPYRREVRRIQHVYDVR